MNRRGFTLVEIIVTILIFGIVSSIIFTTFIQIRKRIYENNWKIELIEEGVRLSNIIKFELMTARVIYFADIDSIFYLNQEGNYSSFSWRDSILFKSNKRLSTREILVPSFRFIYYEPPEFIGENSEPVYSFPLYEIECGKLRVIDWEIKLKKGRINTDLLTGVYLRGIL